MSSAVSPARHYFTKRLFRQATTTIPHAENDGTMDDETSDGKRGTSSIVQSSDGKRGTSSIVQSSDANRSIVNRSIVFTEKNFAPRTSHLARIRYLCPMITHEKITIAVDGFASCGKSTLAKDLAKSLQYTFIDSGAMYRAVTLYFLRQEVNIYDTEEVSKALEKISISFRHLEEGELAVTFLNDENVEREIRSKDVSENVSLVAAISKVRRFLVAQQQAMGKEKGIVMDGRDIGTVVFPDAELKLFITAQIDVRTQRRFDELQRKGIEMTRPQIEANLQERDRIDSTRKDSPLKKAEDAIEIDNSALNRAEQLELALSYVKRVTVERLNG